MPTPCFKDNRFISSRKRDQEVAAKRCGECPFLQKWGEAGLGEPEGVWGGMLPDDPIRVAHRAMNDKTENCRNGHERELYEIDLTDVVPGKEPRGCVRCSSLLLQIAVAS